MSPEKLFSRSCSTIFPVASSSPNSTVSKDEHVQPRRSDDFQTHVEKEKKNILTASPSLRWSESLEVSISIHGPASTFLPFTDEMRNWKDQHNKTQSETTASPYKAALPDVRYLSQLYDNFALCTINDSKRKIR